MPLNPSCLGKTYPPVKTEVTLDALQRYALACNDNNPRYFDGGSADDIVVSMHSRIQHKNRKCKRGNP